MIPLPAPVYLGNISVEAAIRSRSSRRTFSVEPLRLEHLSQLLWAAQGLNGQGMKRTVPSAGALYPLEVYAVAAKITDLDPGVYRYQTQSHSIDMMMAGDLRFELAGAALQQSCIREGSACLVISAVYARTADKYGQRAERYVPMEVGHAGQNIYLQATALGLATVAVGAFDDDRVQRILGMAKNETPLYIMPVGRPDSIR